MGDNITSSIPYDFFLEKSGREKSFVTQKQREKESNSADHHVAIPVATKDNFSNNNDKKEMI
jgi:hypothetical protein